MMAQQQSQKGIARQKVRLPLVGAYSNRDATTGKDQRFINMIPETKKVEQIENTKIYTNKRPGLSTLTDLAAGEGRNLMFFNGKWYATVGNKTYQIDENGANPVVKITWTTTTPSVGATLGNSRVIGDYLFICDGIEGYIIKTDYTATKIRNDAVTSVSVTSGGTGFTDGTYALTFTGGGGAGATGTYTVVGNKVVSVALTDGGSGYTAAPAISFPLGGGSAASGSSTINYFPTPHIPVTTFIDGYIVVAKGSDVYTCVVDDPFSWLTTDYLTAEMFPDPIKSLARQNNQLVVFGSSSTEFFYDAANASGSPLSRNDGAVIQIGIAAPFCVYQNERFCIFVGQSESGGRAVWVIEGFQPKKISDEYIERIIDTETDMSDCHGYGLRTLGHMLFVLNLNTVNRTFVYDLDEKMWHEWSSTSVAFTQNQFAYGHAADNQVGKIKLLHNTTGDVVTLDPTVYLDVADPISCEIYTNKYDMDTYSRKFMSGATLVGDGYSTANVVQLSWSNDDYQTWATDRPIDLNDSFPITQQLGHFRRRAFRLRHSENKPLRLESLEVVYDTGIS